MSRDAELYKDKIEVSLDGRQIFYLFFGGAVIVGLVFVLGVMVGRRVEARGHVDRAHTDASEDPLAALDRLEGGGPSFPSQLLAPAQATPAVEPVDKKIEQIAAAKAEAARQAKAEPKSSKPAEAKAEARREPANKPAARPAAKPEPRPNPDAVAKADASPEREHQDDARPEAKARYTLQLSSFQDKGEAQAFLDDLKAAGFDATLTEANVDGKGTFYRVRLGVYRSMDAANDAKAELERTAKKSAQVMRL